MHTKNALFLLSFVSFVTFVVRFFISRLKYNIVEIVTERFYPCRFTQG